jgi:hypothetical protein
VENRIFIFKVVLFITTRAWAYSPDCAKGPEYWCRDASTAKDCGAVQHCQQTVWRENEDNKQSMTTSETAEMLCTVLVQASTQLLADKTIEIDSIKQYLRQDCTKLPDQNNLIQQVMKKIEGFYKYSVFLVSNGCGSLSFGYSSTYTKWHCKLFSFYHFVFNFYRNRNPQKSVQLFEDMIHQVLPFPNLNSVLSRQMPHVFYVNLLFMLSNPRLLLMHQKKNLL